MAEHPPSANPVAARQPDLQRHDSAEYPICCRTWGGEISLRRDGRTWDLGYPRTVVRPEGKLVMIYYFTTAERPEQHIAATLWHPPAALGAGSDVSNE